MMIDAAQQAFAIDQQYQLHQVLMLAMPTAMVPTQPDANQLHTLLSCSYIPAV